MKYLENIMKISKSIIVKGQRHGLFFILKLECPWLPVAVMPGKARNRALKQPRAFLRLGGVNGIERNMERYSNRMDRFDNCNFGNMVRASRNINLKAIQESGRRGDRAVCERLESLTY